MSIKDPQRRLQVIQTPAVRGWTVAQTATFYDVSESTIYRWRSRYAAEGREGLADRSSRPHTSPGRTDAAVEQHICDLREGSDGRWGAVRIRDELVRAGVDPPAVSTIHQVLVRHGLVDRQPAGQPDDAPKRFVRPCPNDLWQLDATERQLADGAVAQIIDTLDDHSRFMPAMQAWATVGQQPAWDTLKAGIDVHGTPRQLLNDNASWLTGKPRRTVIEFERRCWRQGIDTITSAPYHPQTLGKLERQHRTLHDWLDRQPLAGSLDQLQHQLDRYRTHYNHRRPHQALDGATPAEHYTATPKTEPAGPPPTRETTRQVLPNGTVAYDGWNIGLGRRWAGTIVTLTEHADKLTITHTNQLLRTVALDPQRHPNRYIGTGKPRGRPKKPPHP